jgi:hypothetical protein
MQKWDYYIDEENSVKVDSFKFLEIATIADV